MTTSELNEHSRLMHEKPVLERDFRSDQAGWTLAAVWLVTSISLPLVLWPARTQLAPGARPLMVFLLVYSSLGIARVLISLQPRPAVGMFWFFIYVTSGVVPIAQAHTGLYFYFKGQDYLVPALLITMVGALFFDLGGVLSRVRLRKASADHPRRYPRSLSGSRLSLITALCFPSTAYYVMSVGGPSPFFASRANLAQGFVSAGLRDGSQVGSAFLITFGQVPVLIAFASWLVLYTRDPTIRTTRVRLLLIVLGAMNLVVNNPISNARYWFLTVAIGLLYCRPRLKLTTSRFALVGAVLFAIIAFPYSDYFRNTAANRHGIVVQSVSQTLSSKDFDQVTMTGNGVWYASQYGHTDGHQFLGLLLFWVPRSLWSGKPLDTGVLIGQHLVDAGTTNLSSPMWIEFWLDGSYVGTAVGLGVFGFLLARLDTQYQIVRAANFRFATISEVMLPFLAGYSLILLRGPLLQAMSRLAVMLAVFALLSTRVTDATGVEGDGAGRRRFADELREGLLLRRRLSGRSAQRGTALEGGRWPGGRERSAQLRR